MLRCKDVVKKLSSGDEPPSMMMRIHLLLCKHCATYAAQLKMLHSGFQDLLKTKAQSSQARVREIEQAVLEKLRRKTSE